MGSFGVDIDLRFNTASALKSYKEFSEQAKKLTKDVADGVAGSQQKLEKLQQDFARNMISNTTRQGRALESSIKSLERQAELAGKTYSQQLLVRQEKWIKALGDDEKAVKRVTAAFQQLIKTEEEAEKKRGAGHAGSGNLLLRGARDIFEGRMTYGVMDIGRAGLQMMGGGGGAAGAAGAAAGAGGAGMLAGISATTLAVTGLAAAFVGVEAVGFKAAEAVGEYAQKTREAMVVTGLTSHEVQQLGYVAKVTGQDISTLNRMTRGLTQAVTDTGSHGQKARETLQGMGVDVIALQHGYVSTNDLLKQVGAALEHQPNIWLRNKEAIDLFKRAGIDSLPMLTEMNNLLRKSEGVQFMGDEQMEKFRKIREDIELAKVQWEQFILSVEASLAKPFILTVKVVREGWGVMPSVPGGIPAEGNDVNELYTWRNRSRAAFAEMGRRDQERQFEVNRANRPAMVYQQSMDYLRSDESLEAAEGRLQDLKKTYDEARVAGKQGLIPLDEIKQATAEYEKQKKLVEGMRDAEADRKNIAEALRRTILEGEQQRENPFALPAEAALNRNLRMRGVSPADAFSFSWHAAPQIMFERNQQAAKFGTQMLEVQQTVAREMDRARAGGVLPVNIRQLGVGGVTRADVVSDLNSQEQQRRDIAMETFEKEYKLIKDRKIDAQDRVALAKQQDDIVAATGKLAVAQVEAEMSKKREMYALDQHERDLARQHAETMSRIQLADQEESIKHQADLERKTAGLRFKGDNPAAGIAEEYRIAVTESQQLYDLEMQRIALHETGFKAEEDSAIALHKLHREDEQAREEAQFKLAEMQQQQLDTLKSKVEPLYHTLFTDPKNFGKQLRSTVQEAALHPLVSGLSEMTATALHPLIYGAGGTGGIAGSLGGMFGGGHKFSDLTLLPDKSVPVTIVSDQSGGGGGGGGGGAVGGGLLGGGGAGLPSGGLGARFRRFLVNPGGDDWATVAPQIRGNESSNNYGAYPPKPTPANPHPTASGAYGFINTTWQEAARATGMGGQYKTAREAPSFIQDVNAKWLYGQYGANSSHSWGASAPPGGYGGGGITGGGEVPASVYGGMPTFSTTVYGRSDVDAATMGGPSALSTGGGDMFDFGGGGGGTGGGGGGTVASNLAAVALASMMGGGTRGGGGGGFNGAGLLGMGKGLLQNWRNLLGQSKPAVFGETPGQESMNRLGGSGMGGFSLKGLGNSPLAKAGAGTVGMMLAQQGLLGNARGTGMGVLEGTLGGAGVGFSMGGPLGAAIGAGVGLGVGLGEMIAGVESPRNEAKRLVQATYHIGINNATADQIVNMANQSYGGRVSLAVRSPEVRHMLGLYAAGTGQGSIFANSANEAHGASLVQSGGVLSQQATYQYGQAFSQSSNLPVYGGTPTHVLGAPGGGMNLSLNIGGQDAAKFLTGNVVTPDVVQGQYASAMYSSAGRVPQALMMSQPGAIAS